MIMLVVNVYLLFTLLTMRWCVSSSTARRRNSFTSRHKTLLPTVALAIPLFIAIPCTASQFEEENSPVSEIVTVKNSLKKLSREETSVTKLFSQIEYLLNVYQLRSRLAYAMSVLPGDERVCGTTTAAKAVEDLYSIIEYYSVAGANSGNEKMMISDSFPVSRIPYDVLYITNVVS